MALTDAELQDKFDELVVPVLGNEQAQAIAKMLWQLQAQNVVTGF